MSADITVSGPKKVSMSVIPGGLVEFQTVMKALQEVTQN
jgi:hypothetical protein